MVYPVISAGIIPEIEVRRGGVTPPLNRYEKYKDSIPLGKLNARTLGSIALIRKTIKNNPKAYGGLTCEETATNILT